MLDACVMDLGLRSVTCSIQFNSIRSLSILPRLATVPYFITAPRNSTIFVHVLMYSVDDLEFRRHLVLNSQHVESTSEPIVAGTYPTGRCFRSFVACVQNVRWRNCLVESKWLRGVFAITCGAMTSQDREEIEETWMKDRRTTAGYFGIAAATSKRCHGQALLLRRRHLERLDAAHEYAGAC